MGRLSFSLHRATRVLRDTSGQFALMTAIIAPVAITLAAFAVDAGSLYVEKRQAQALVDLAAITATANLGKAEQAAMVTFADNGATDAASGNNVTVVTGHYNAVGAVPKDRFTAGADPVNAARVVYRTTGSRYFAGAIIPPPEIVVSATAGTEAEAAFSVGSRLAALDGGIVNALLGGLTGSSISLSVMDYNALLGTDVSLLSFLDQLAIDLDLEAGSYQQALDTSVTVGQIAKALSKTPGTSGNAKAAAGKLAFQASGGRAPTLQLSRLIDLGQSDGNLVAANIEQIGADVGVLEILALSAVVAGKGKQVALNLGANVPGLLAVTVDLAIGEPPQQSPWLRIGSDGDVVRTAQTRLSLVAEIGGLGGLLGAKIRIPLYLELAFAEARLKSVTCPSGSPANVKVAVEARPGIANLYLAEVNPAKIVDFANPAPRSPARLVQMPLVSVTAQAHAEIAEMGYRTLTFSASDISSGKVKQVSTQAIVGSLTKSLFSSLQLDVNVIGLGIGLPSNLTGLLGQTIGAAAPALDAVLVNLLSTLGLALGQADVRVHGATAGGPFWCSSQKGFTCQPSGGSSVPSGSASRTVSVPKLKAQNSRSPSASRSKASTSASWPSTSLMLPRRNAALSPRIFSIVR